MRCMAQDLSVGVKAFKDKTTLYDSKFDGGSEGLNVRTTHVRLWKSRGSKLKAHCMARQPLNVHFHSYFWFLFSVGERLGRGMGRF